jgi:transcriptional regulator GlxA family with amidase domain
MDRSFEGLPSMSKHEQKMPNRNILILVYPGVQIIDVAGPAQVLSTANEEGATPPYKVQVVAFRPGVIETASGLSLLAAEIPTDGDFNTIVIPGGPGVHMLRADPRAREMLREMIPRAERVCAVCTGAFLLASAGLLDGRTAVTHWRSCDQLAREFPSIHVDPSPIFLNDGTIWTTAGVTAGIDLMLSLVQQDHSAALAARVARRLVVYMRRPGDQKQYSDPLALQATSSAPYGELTQRIMSDPSAAWTVERMADNAGQSLRTFRRRFQAATGMLPAEAVEKIRCDLAHALLQTTNLSMEQIAVRAGFGSEIRFRRATVRRYGVTPSEMRARFASTTDAMESFSS